MSAGPSLAATAASASVLGPASSTAAPAPAVILGLDPRISGRGGRRVEPGDDGGGGARDRPVEPGDDGMAGVVEPGDDGMMGRVEPGGDGGAAPAEQGDDGTVGPACAVLRSACATAAPGTVALGMAGRGAVEPGARAPGPVEHGGGTTP